jgi:hypothetical protein
MIEKFNMAATSVLAIFGNLCGITKKKLNKNLGTYAE